LQGWRLEPLTSMLGDEVFLLLHHIFNKQYLVSCYYYDHVFKILYSLTIVLKLGT
jgi:hypothetical protein